MIFSFWQEDRRCLLHCISLAFSHSLLKFSFAHSSSSPPLSCASANSRGGTNASRLLTLHPSLHVLTFPNSASVQQTFLTSLIRGQKASMPLPCQRRASLLLEDTNEYKFAPERISFSFFLVQPFIIRECAYFLSSPRALIFSSARRNIMHTYDANRFHVFPRGERRGGGRWKGRW